MKSIPGRVQVDRALKSTLREVKSAIKRVNQQASKLMSRGDYEGAQTMMELGRGVRDFQNEVEALRGRWRTLRISVQGTGGVKAETTPDWKLYSPILRTLMANGGTMTWKAIEDALRSNSEFQPLPGDLQVLRGKPRWVHTAHRARGGMVKEGFIEKRAGFEWRITPAGKKAAESGAVDRD